MQYLTVEYALEDLAKFQRWYMAKEALTGPWIAVGGSYPGSLSAMYRLTHPELVKGALASSAPIMAKENFEEYDLDVATVAGDQCAASMRKVVSEVEQALGNPAKLSEIKALFDATAVDDPVDFLYVIADMGAIAVQYGHRDEFCHDIETAADPLNGYAVAGKKMFQAFGITALQDSFQGAMSENPDD